MTCAALELYQRTLPHLLAPVWGYLHDPEVLEVLINGPDKVYIETRRGGLEKTAARFADAFALEAALRHIAQFAGRRLHPGQPILSARLPEGHRVHIVQPPVARNGLCVTIRKHSEQQPTLAELIAGDTLTVDAAEFLSIAIALGRNIVVAGEAGAGKTTLLNALSEAIPAQARILTLEDIAELKIKQPHTVSLESQAADRNGQGGVEMSDLLRASLRMRPDRLIVGECLGAEALVMIQALTSGHSGMTTCHADTPLDALRRLENMALAAKQELQPRMLRAQLVSAVDLVVQIARQRDHRRRVTAITEVYGSLTDSGDYVTRELFRWSRPAGTGTAALEWSGQQPEFRALLWERGYGDMIRRTGYLWQ